VEEFNFAKRNFLGLRSDFVQKADYQKLRAIKPFSRGHDVKKRKLHEHNDGGLGRGRGIVSGDFIYSYPNNNCSPLDTFSRSHPFLSSLVCHSKNVEDYNYSFTNPETYSHATNN
jgi:hypothetical protein